MSAPVPLPNGFGPRAIARSPEPAGTAAGTDGRRPDEIIRCVYRPPDADFYCWKFGVWYNLMDCCYRHEQRTYEGCVDCGQGRVNLRQNLERYRAAGPRRGPVSGP